MLKRWMLMLAPFVPVCASGGTNQWTYTGPTGAMVRQVEYVNDTGTVIAMSGRRIYRSTDHGDTWTAVLSTKFGSYETQLVTNPANRNQALALLDKLYSTTDGGASWTPVTSGTLPNVGNGETPRAFAWSRDGSKVWSGSSTGSIYRSVDGGLIWSKQLNGGFAASAIMQMGVDATDANRAYALSANTLFATDNGGTNWNTSNSTPLNWIAASPTQTGVLLGILNGDGTIVRSTNYGVDFIAHSADRPTGLYYAPSQSGTVYATYATADVAISRNEGATWSSYSLSRRGSFDVAISPSDPDRAMLATNAGPLMTDNGLANWSMRTRGMLELPFNSLTSLRDAGGGGRLYAGTGWGNENAYVRGANGSWLPLGAATKALLGDPSTFISFEVAPSDGTLYLARAGNFGASVNNDLSWTRRGAYDGAYQMAIDPANSQIIYATDGYVTSRMTIDGGANWNAFGADLPEDVSVFAVNGKHPNRIYALKRDLASFPQNPLYVSENGGTTWTMASGTVSLGIEGYAIAYEPGSENTVYIGLEGGMFKTTDGGANWTRLDPYPATITQDRIASISVDPDAPQTVYVTTHYDYPPMRSVDGGANWEPLHAEAADDEGMVDTVIVDPSTPNTLAGLLTYGGIVELKLAPDLVLTSTGVLSAGGAGSVALTATNNGPYTATLLRLTATLPAATGGYVLTPTAGLTCAVTGVSLSCDAPRLRPAATAAITIAFTPAASGAWQAQVAAREADSATTNNSLNLAVAAASSGGGSSSGAGGESGGGGGRLDYLLAALLGFALLARRRVGRA
jgi:photosystem II stability/assembly factor-like uncharacterized protein